MTTDDRPVLVCAYCTSTFRRRSPKGPTPIYCSKACAYYGGRARASDRQRQRRAARPWRTIRATIPADVHAALQQAAKDQDRSPAAIITRALRTHLGLDA